MFIRFDDCKVEWNTFIEAMQIHLPWSHEWRREQTNVENEANIFSNTKSIKNSQSICIITVHDTFAEKKSSEKEKSTQKL